MKRQLFILVVSTLVMMMACTTWTMSTRSENVPRMTKDELKAMIDNPDVTIIDVRHDQDWKGSDVRIKGAVREDPNDVKSCVDKYAKDRLIILYCA
jgi:3-mercaptopyruvate sulfurtransferase SseA